LEIEIHPAPSEAERAAITEALTGLRVDEPAPSAWWRAGVDENVDTEAEPAS
jgi:hypothetical protein